MSLLPRPDAKRALGQNFLIDQNIIRKIVATINPRPDETIYEIGPGSGALTAPLLDAGAKLTVIEKDISLAEQLAATPLAQTGQLTVINADATAFDWQQIGKAKIAGNLPYNVASQIIFNMLPHLATLERPFTFMVQKEVAERITAKPGSKAWGKLGLWCQFYTNPSFEFVVPPGAFKPKPKVDSAIVQLMPLPTPRFTVETKKLKQVIDTAFVQRRKMLRASLKGLLSEDQLSAAGIVPTARPETLSLEDFCKLAEQL